MKRKLKKIVALTIVSCMLLTSCCFATSIQDSKIITGTQALINDLTNSMLFIVPAISVGFIIYYLVRKMAADEDAHRWDGKIKVAIICCIAVFVVASLIKIIISYYQ